MSQAINSLKSICIIRLSSIGDVTHMIPIINTLKHFAPNTDITWIIGKTEYDLVKNIKNIKFIIIDKNDIFNSIKSLLSLRKGKRFDIFLHMQVSLRSNLLSLFIKADRKIGYNQSLSKNFHSLFRKEKIDCHKNPHVIETFFCFLKKIGIEDKKLDWSIKLDDPKDVINLKGIKYIVINPFTSSRRLNYREWDINNYKNITDYVFNKYGIESIIVGSKTDYQKKESEKICDKGFIHNFVGKTDLQQLCNIIKDCEFYIGPDSGALHLATMLSKPVIGLYATSNPYRTGPYNNMDFVINKYPDALMKYKKKKVSDVKWGERIRNKNAMSLITKEDVKDKIGRILGA